MKSGERRLARILAGTNPHPAVFVSVDDPVTLASEWLICPQKRRSIFPNPWTPGPRERSHLEIRHDGVRLLKTGHFGPHGEHQRLQAGQLV